MSTRKCLGGVKIGSVKKKELKSMAKVSACSMETAIHFESDS